MAQVLESLPLIWETQMKFMAPGFHVVQPWPAGPFGEWSSRWNISVILSNKLGQGNHRIYITIINNTTFSLHSYCSEWFTTHLLKYYSPGGFYDNPRMQAENSIVSISTRPREVQGLDKSHVLKRGYDRVMKPDLSGSFFNPKKQIPICKTEKIAKNLNPCKWSGRLQVCHGIGEFCHSLELPG